MRDFAAELRVILEEEFKDGDSVPVVAHAIVGKLRANDPLLLAGWLDTQAVGLVADEIRRIQRLERNHARSQSARGAFREAAESGDATALQGFLNVRYVVDDSRTRLSLGKMNAAQCKYVAAGYEKSSKSALMEAAFFKALARKVRSHTVEEVFTEEQIERLRESLAAV